MKQVWIPRIGDPSVLEVREAPDPDAGPGAAHAYIQERRNFGKVLLTP